LVLSIQESIITILPSEDALAQDVK
jgi:subtilisin family serine protease